MKTVFVGSNRSGYEWKSDLTLLAVTTLSCVDSFSCQRVVCVDEYGLWASVAVTPVSVVISVFDLNWVLEVIRRQFVGQLSGLDLHGVLDILKYRLNGVINDAFFDELPELRRESSRRFLLVHFFFFFFVM